MIEIMIICSIFVMIGIVIFQAGQKEHERNLIQCYQNSVVYASYLSGRVEYESHNNNIGFTIIDTNTRVHLNTQNCTITKLEPSK